MYKISSQFQLYPVSEWLDKKNAYPVSELWEMHSPSFSTYQFQFQSESGKQEKKQEREEGKKMCIFVDNNTHGNRPPYLSEEKEKESEFGIQILVMFTSIEQASGVKQTTTFVIPPNTSRWIEFDAWNTLIQVSKFGNDIEIVKKTGKRQEMFFQLWSLI